MDMPRCVDGDHYPRLGASVLAYSVLLGGAGTDVGIAASGGYVDLCIATRSGYFPIEVLEFQNAGKPRMTGDRLDLGGPYMRISYDDVDDIGNIAYAETGIAEITILEAKAAGYWPIENVKDVLPAAA